MGTSHKIKIRYAESAVIRLIAAHVVVLSLAALFLQSKLLVGFLVIDFGIRAFASFRSPLARSAQLLQLSLQLKSAPIFLPAKRFAAQVGFLLTAAWLLLLLADFAQAGNYLGGLLFLCASLEGLFQICLGCYLYSWLVVPLASRFKR